MNRPPPGFRSVINRWPLAMVALLLGAFPLAAQNPPAAGSPTNRPPTERFLLIVETSAALQKRAENVQRVVGNLFASGLRGELDPGDTIGAWTYDDTLHTGQFPLQRWASQNRQQITVGLVQLLQSRKFEKEARVAAITEPMANIVTNSYRITVLLISDGSDARLGTPFDDKIAAAYKLNATEQQRQQMPFVTVLRAEKGKHLGFTVSTPPWPVEFPTYPSEPRADAKPGPPPTNLPPPVMPAPVAVPVENVPERPRIEAIDASLTNAVVAATNPPVVVTTNVVESPLTPPKADPATNAAAIEPPVPAPPQDPTVAAAAPPERKLPLVPLVIAGSAAALALAILSFALLRRSRPTARVSLITRSMNKDAK